MTIFNRKLLPLTIAALATVSANAQDDIQEVVVTGSYIRGTPEDAASPVTVMTREDIVLSGVSDISGLLRNMTEMNGGDTAPFANPGTQQGPGVGSPLTNVSLRGLGPTATLTMMDGKRLPFVGKKSRSGERFVDISTIPVNMIERVEVLRDGGSALYGSDAIAGVANFITRTDFEGFELGTRYQELQKGSANDVTLDALYGWSSEDSRTHFTIGGTYRDRERQLAGDGFLDKRVGLYEGQGYSDFSNLAEPIESCQALGMIHDTSDGNPNNCEWFSAPFGVIQDAVERTNVMANFDHAFSDTFEVYAQYNFAKSEAGGADSFNTNSPLASQREFNPFFASGATGGVIPAPGANYFANNPYLEANGGPNTLGGALFSVDPTWHIPGLDPARGPINAGSTVEVERYQLGFRGEFTVADKTWDYDFSYSDAESSYEEFSDYIDANKLTMAVNGLGGPSCVPDGGVTLADANGDPAATARIAAARAVVDSLLIKGPGGDPLANVQLVVPDGLVAAMSSTNKGDQANGCYFLNALTSRLDPSRPNLHNPPELLNWLEGEHTLADSTTIMETIDFVMTGELFDLSAGTVQMAFGLHRRTEGRQQVLSPFTNTINSFGFLYSNDAVVGPYENQTLAPIERDIDALFTEFHVPLLDTLEMQLAVRYEDYGGRVGDTVDPKIAFRFQPNESLVLRASAGTSFRGPSLAQLVEGGGFAVKGGPRDPLADPLVRQGVTPVPDFADATIIPFAVIDSLASPLAKPETARTFNIGGIWTPETVEGLTLSLDYYDIAFEDKLIDSPFELVIQNEVDLFNQALAAGDFVDVTTNLPCAQGSSASCEVNPTAYVSPDTDLWYVARNDNGQAAVVGGPTVNAGAVDTSGIDFEASYAWANSAGLWRSSLRLSHILEYKVQDIPGGEDFDGAGNTNSGGSRSIVRSMPDLQANATFAWIRDSHTVSLNARYIGSYDDSDFDRLSDQLGSYVTVNARYGYDWELQNGSVLDFALGVNDLFDANAPDVRSFSGVDLQVVDPRGRIAYLEARYSL